jgi:hypothetical protein
MAIILGIIISLIVSVYELLTQQRGIVWIAYGILNPLILLLPRVVYYRWRGIRERATIGMVKRIELFGALVIALNVPGSLFFHDMGVQYDRVIHFSTVILYVLMASLIVSLFYEKPSDNKKHILKWSGIAVFLGLFLFELFQFTLDTVFETHLFFDLKQSITVDILEDILFGTAGLVSGLLLVYYRK